MTPKSPLSWKLIRFENGSAILESSTSKLVIPRTQLPDNCQDGDILTAEFYLLKDDKKRKENIARALLEEILGK